MVVRNWLYMIRPFSLSSGFRNSNYRSVTGGEICPLSGDRQSVSVTGSRIKPGQDFWFYVRSVTWSVNPRLWKPAGMPVMMPRISGDVPGKDRKTASGTGIVSQIDNGQLKDEMAEMKTTITKPGTKSHRRSIKSWKTRVPHTADTACAEGDG